MKIYSRYLSARIRYLKSVKDHDIVFILYILLIRNVFFTWLYVKSFFIVLFTSFTLWAYSQIWIEWWEIYKSFFLNFAQSCLTVNWGYLKKCQWTVCSFFFVFHPCYVSVSRRPFVILTSLTLLTFFLQLTTAVRELFCSWRCMHKISW